MPRAVQSKETQILEWFKTAPLAVAALVLNLVKDTVRERQATLTPIRQPAPRAAAPAAPKARVRKPAKAKPAAAKPRKRVRPSRAKAAQAAPAGGGDAQVEDLGGKAGG